MMGLMTDKDKKVPRIHMNLLTVSTSRDASLNIAVSGLLLFLPTYILFFFPTKEVDNEKCIGGLSNETSEYMLCTSSILKHTLIQVMKTLQLSLTTEEHSRASYSTNKLELADTCPSMTLVLVNYFLVSLC